jgi:hypothetical protein
MRRSPRNDRSKSCMAPRKRMTDSVRAAHLASMASRSRAYVSRRASTSIRRRRRRRRASMRSTYRDSGAMAEPPSSESSLTRSLGESLITPARIAKVRTRVRRVPTSMRQMVFRLSPVASASCARVQPASSRAACRRRPRARSPWRSRSVIGRPISFLRLLTLSLPTCTDGGIRGHLHSRERHCKEPASTAF